MDSGKDGIGMNLYIETERLILRQWQISDIKTLINLTGQKHIEHWMPDWREYDKHAKSWIEMVLSHYKSNNPMDKFVSWAITLKKCNKLIGQIAIGCFDKLGEKELSIGYWLGMEYTNCGYMTEAVNAVTNFAYKKYGYDHIIATIQPENLPSNAVIKKAGYKLISTINILDDGQTEVLPFHYYRSDNPYRIISIREYPAYLDRAVDYFSSKWGVDRKIYETSILDGITTENPLPRWYLMLKGDEIIGSYGLIENDFMVRKDLMPWLCALYVEESERGKSLGLGLLTHGQQEAAKLGFPKIYLCTDHTGYYEKYGWQFFGMEASEWGGDTRVYEIESEG